MPGSVLQAEHPIWLQSVGAWLYDTSHINIEYGIQYDGVSDRKTVAWHARNCSALLYLCCRSARSPTPYHRPTRENLDPKSVFVELVPHFRHARKRRQVIVVTHNANLVVNTDADQVIVATSVQTTEEDDHHLVPSRTLENPDIRSLVCEILEGGERERFLKRERRYRLRWGETYRAADGANRRTVPRSCAVHRLIVVRDANF